MRAVLIANGSISDYESIKKYIEDDAVIICADGGYDHAEKLGIEPDILIGDMDSIKSRGIATEKIVYPKRKDFTDSELVLEYAAENGFDSLVLIGFIGTRLDHTVTNLELLCKYESINAVMVDEHNEIRRLKKENVISGKKGDIVSVIPLGGDISDITTEGLEYPLDGETLFFGTGRGVSNVMTGEKCVVKVGSGRGLIIKSRD